MAVTMGLTTAVQSGGDIRITVVVDDHFGVKRLRAVSMQETLSNQTAKRALTDLRDLADRALQRHWPEDRAHGQHERVVG